MEIPDDPAARSCCLPAAADTESDATGYPGDRCNRTGFVHRPVGAVCFLEALAYYPSTYFVAVCDGAVEGFVVGGLEDTGENIYGHICNLGVSPRYRRRGIGKLLVNRVEHQFALELATGVQLEVRFSNTAAQRFYHRMGYHNVFGIEHYYSNGEDAIVMMKWFRF